MDRLVIVIIGCLFGGCVIFSESSGAESGDIRQCNLNEHMQRRWSFCKGKSGALQAKVFMHQTSKEDAKAPFIAYYEDLCSSYLPNITSCVREYYTSCSYQRQWSVVRATRIYQRRWCNGNQLNAKFRNGMDNIIEAYYTTNQKCSIMPMVNQWFGKTAETHAILFGMMNDRGNISIDRYASLAKRFYSALFASLQQSYNKHCSASVADGAMTLIMAEVLPFGV